MSDESISSNELDDLRAELVRLRLRESVLLDANNAELQRRRDAEDEANQTHCELQLVRKECIRLRNALCVLIAFIERLSWQGRALMTPDVQDAMESVFLPGPKDRA